MRYWQIERFVTDLWLATDFRIHGKTREEAAEHMNRIAENAGWTVRLGCEISAEYNYCDFAWVNMP